MHRAGQILLLLVLAAMPGGCSATAPTNPARPKPPPLANVDAFPEGYREAARTVAGALAQTGERAEEFYAEVEPQEGGQRLIFHLWHESAFEAENRNVVGNPGGKCRDVYYDARQHKVTQTLFWQ